MVVLQIASAYIHFSASSSCARRGARGSIHLSPRVCSAALEVGVILILLMRRQASGGE